MLNVTVRELDESLEVAEAYVPVGDLSGIALRD